MKKTDVSLAAATYSNGDLAGGLAESRKVLDVLPDQVVALNIAALCSIGLGAQAEAERYWRRAVKASPNDADLHLNLGLLQQEMGRLGEAEALFRRVLKLKPGYVEGYFNLGNVLRALDKLPEAEAALRKAIALRADYAEAYNNLGLVLQSQKRFGEAEAVFQRALELNPGQAETHNNFGLLWLELRQFTQSERALHRAVALRADYFEAYNNLGLLYKDMERFAEAETAYRRAISLAPDYPEAQMNLGMLLLFRGQLAQGWPYYEARYSERRKARFAPPPPVAYPSWRGETLRGKSLLVWTEQGFGDSLQFVRYLSLLKALGAKQITLACEAPLLPLLRSVAGVDVLVTREQITELPAHDFWVRLLSVPLHCHTTLANIPAAIPYLAPPAERLQAWGGRLKDLTGLKVGLVWKGSATHTNDANRSLPSLDVLSPLWPIPGVSFVSLQKGAGEDEVLHLPEHVSFCQLGTDIKDFADTAAIVQHLDLVICVDTAVAHVAGALGKPCWVMVPRCGTDWRWLGEGQASPWYPGWTRLFRQAEPGDWSSPISEIAAALSHSTRIGKVEPLTKAASARITTALKSTLARLKLF